MAGASWLAGSVVARKIHFLGSLFSCQTSLGTGDLHIFEVNDAENEVKLSFDDLKKDSLLEIFKQHEVERTCAIATCSTILRVLNLQGQYPISQITKFQT